jgi:pyruvate,water dikinase
MAENPIHQLSGPATAWATTNAAEALPGVMTPLAFTTWFPPLERGIRAAFHTLGVLRAAEVGVPESIDERTSAIFFGRYAGNLETLRRFSDLTPGTSGDDFERQMFGTVRPDARNYRSKRRYPVVAVKAPVMLARLPRWVEATAADIDGWWRATTTPGRDTRPALSRFHEGQATLERALHVHMAATFISQGLSQQLGVLAAAAGKPDLELRLSTGYSLEETRLVAHLYRVAHDGGPLDEFLQTYGFHGPAEGELSSHSWRERPEIVETLARKYRESRRGDPLENEAAQVRRRGEAEQELLAALPAGKRPGAKVLLRLAQRYVPLREITKATFLRALDGLRAAARARGHELVAAGKLADVEDIFYLTVDEIADPVPDDAGGLVVERRRLRKEYEGFTVPKFWIGNPEPVPLTTAAGAERVSEITGIGASAGVVEGRVRVITDALDCDRIEPGEILVCHTTDPSWASAFHLVAAVVIDVGSIASHGAIVSREFGIPCVINTGNGTETLRTGDVVRIDGTAGTVTVLTPA